MAHTQDRTIAVWDMESPKNIVLRRVLTNSGFVNEVEFDDRYIVSGSGDKIIRVGSANEFKCNSNSMRVYVFPLRYLHCN